MSMTQFYETQMEKALKNRDSEIASLNKQFAAKEISYEVYASARKACEEKYDAIYKDNEMAIVELRCS